MRNKGAHKIKRKHYAKRRADPIADHGKRRPFWGERGVRGVVWFSILIPVSWWNFKTPCAQRAKWRLRAKWRQQAGTKTWARPCFRGSWSQPFPESIPIEFFMIPCWFMIDLGNLQFCQIRWCICCRFGYPFWRSPCKLFCPYLQLINKLLTNNLPRFAKIKQDQKRSNKRSPSINRQTPLAQTELETPSPTIEGAVMSRPMASSIKTRVDRI